MTANCKPTRTPNYQKGLDRVDAWHQLVATEGRAASLAAVARIFDSHRDGPCGNFVVVPSTDLTPGPESRLVPSGEILALPRKPGRFNCRINEVYNGPRPHDWRLVACEVLKDWAAEDIAPLMAGLDLDLVLVADGSGVGLLHLDGRREPMVGKVDEEGVLAAWREWSRRRFPDGPALQRLHYPVAGWTSSFAQRRAEGLRLKAVYGRTAVEAAIQRIIAGI